MLSTRALNDLKVGDTVALIAGAFGCYRVVKHLNVERKLKTKIVFDDGKAISLIHGEWLGAVPSGYRVESIERSELLIACRDRQREINKIYHLIADAAVQQRLDDIKMYIARIEELEANEPQS